VGPIPADGGPLAAADRPGDDQPMSRYAILSDIHGNLFALEAVLGRLSGQTFDEIVCLGDIVGYGPFPGECIDLVMRTCSVIVRGNHDDAVVDPVAADVFNGVAREAIYWTIEHLGPLHRTAMVQLKPTWLMNDRVMCIHDCPVPAPTDYVHDKAIAAMAFRGVTRPICLLGHTHVPMVFETEETDPAQALSAPQVTAYLPTDGVPVQLDRACRYICNPGSVGQPRDADPRASFAILDLEAMTYTVHRQDYDINAAQEATMRAGLPFVLAERLGIGA
jgi:predicted phosphodiesterase